ncbi:hypothetical protein BLOT_011278 [Blomia tropicalis]|nr:hypothetical protein BLOT_011278 [Blomia tropicalis]
MNELNRTRTNVQLAKATNGVGTIISLVLVLHLHHRIQKSRIKSLSLISSVADPTEHAGN